MMGGTAAAGAMGPSWLTGAFAAVMIATAVYCAGRIIAARRWRRPTGYDIDAVHVLMGTAMAGMLVPGLRFGPAGGWEMVFGAAAGWFGWRAWRGRGPAGHGPAQHVQHLLASLAMLYMLLAVGPAPSGAAATAMGGSTHLRTLALVLALALLGCVINSADRLTALPLAAGTAAARTAPPASAATVTAPPGPAGPARPGTPASPADAAATARTPALSPRLAACCDIAMGVTMGYLLVLMISS
jgi:Domain of unknown function (DUF5134)